MVIASAFPFRLLLVCPACIEENVGHWLAMICEMGKELRPCLYTNPIPQTHN